MSLRQSGHAFSHFTSVWLRDKHLRFPKFSGIFPLSAENTNIPQNSINELISFFPKFFFYYRIFQVAELLFHGYRLILIIIFTVIAEIPNLPGNKNFNISVFMTCYLFSRSLNLNFMVSVWSGLFLSGKY